jgi:hypothetical protein
MVAVVDPRIGLLDPAAIAFPHDARANAPTGASVRDLVRLEEVSSVVAAVAGASRIDNDTVRVLAGPQAPAQYAQASEVAAAQPIGRTETITGDVTIDRADGTEEQLG